MSIPDGYSFFEHRFNHPEDLIATFGEAVFVEQYRYNQDCYTRIYDANNRNTTPNATMLAHEEKLGRWIDNAQDYLPEGEIK